MAQEPSSPNSRRKSSVRHTRAIQRDRRCPAPGPPPPADLAERLTDRIYPVALQGVSEFHCRGRRERLLTLPVRVAWVLALIWRHQTAPS
jgi:hypothetical protein